MFILRNGVFPEFEFLSSVIFGEKDATTHFLAPKTKMNIHEFCFVI